MPRIPNKVAGADDSRELILLFPPPKPPALILTLRGGVVAVLLLLLFRELRTAWAPVMRGVIPLNAGAFPFKVMACKKLSTSRSRLDGCSGLLLAAVLVAVSGCDDDNGEEESLGAVEVVEAGWSS